MSQSLNKVLAEVYAKHGRKYKPKPTYSGFVCMECGYKFRTVKAAERAAFGDRGCPRCGSSDIDLD